MEPLKIQIEFSVSDASLKAIDNIVSIITAGIMVNRNPEAASELAKAIIDDQTAPKEPAEPAPVKEAEAAPVEAEVKEISDAEMVEFIKSVKGKVPAKSVKEIFAKYGCSCSTGCPMESRQAMINDIKALLPNA